MEEEGKTSLLNIAPPVPVVDPSCPGVGVGSGRQIGSEQCVCAGERNTVGW